MNKIKNLTKEIPPTTSEIQIDVEGEVTKKRFLGEFTCQIPRKKEQCLIDKHRSFLNGPSPENLDPATLRFHHMISYLRYTITDSPKWWKETDLGYELYDDNVVTSVYDAVLEFENAWLKKIWGEEEFNRKFAPRQEGRNDEAKAEGA